MVKRLAVTDVNLCVGCQSCIFACSRRFGSGGMDGSCIHVKSAGGIRKGFVVVVCRACATPSCASVCPTGALVHREGGGVKIKVDECIGCGNCVEACPFGAVFWDDDQNKPQICIHCGYCVSYCPYGVIALEEIKEVTDAAR